MIPNNYAAQIIAWVPKKLRGYPRFSTWCAALFLSFVWTTIWLGIFFVTTWMFKLETKASDFVNVFWLSIAAEAVIRWAENTNFVAALSKPNEAEPRGDNADFRLKKALSLFILAGFLMFCFDFVLERFGFDNSHYSIVGQGLENGINPIRKMIDKWWYILTSGGIAVPILVGTIFRAWIYKRRP